MDAVTINFSIVLAYMAAMLGIGVWLTRYVRGSEDYFIAGRSLNRWVICGSIMSTNVAAVYLVGPAGRSYHDGIALLLMAWTGNMLAAISAVTFLPRFRRLRITTISELLRKRYGASVAIAVAAMWILFYALASGVTMFTCATVLAGAFDWEESFVTITVIVAVVVVLYCLFSGLLAVVYTDLLQSFLIILGAVILLPLALKAGGGIEVLFDLEKITPDKWTMWRPLGQPDDYRTILMLLTLGLPYWFTSQYMLQRSFAGRNTEEASKGLLWAALLTGPLTLCYIVPAMVAGVNPEFQLPEGQRDSILPLLAQRVMPVGIGGIFLAALVAASNSTASSFLNSVATLFERDLYRPLRPERSERHYLVIGRTVTVLAGLVGLGYAIYSYSAGLGVLTAAWRIGSIFQPAIFVVVASALFFRRGTTAGALACLVIGICYTFTGAMGGWEALGQTLGMSDFLFFQWDHTKPTTLALVGMPLSAAVLVAVSLCTSQQERDHTWLDRMKFRSGEWTPRRKLSGLSAGLCLLGMILFAFLDRQLPKPWNVPIYLLLLSGFIVSVMGCAGALLPAEETEVHVRAPIEDSLFARYLATGKTWAAVYILAAILVVVLYLL